MGQVLNPTFSIVSLVLLVAVLSRTKSHDNSGSCLLFEHFAGSIGLPNPTTTPL
jgi:hypothetical protein